MVLPMPPMPQQEGRPASEYAKGKSLQFTVLLTLATVATVLEIFPGLDIMGGFIHSIGIGLGWYARMHDMDVQFMCYCGIFSLIQGVFGMFTMSMGLRVLK